MEVEARDRFWHEVDRIGTGILLIAGSADGGALPVNCTSDRLNHAIRFQGAAVAAEGLKLAPGQQVCVTFADLPECLFITLLATVRAVDTGMPETALEPRRATTQCNVGSGIVITVEPVSASLWERPGRSFLDALERLTNASEEARGVSTPRKIRF